jgi:hypothetical protein
MSNSEQLKNKKKSFLQFVNVQQILLLIFTLSQTFGAATFSRMAFNKMALGRKALIELSLLLMC